MSHVWAQRLAYLLSLVILAAVLLFACVQAAPS